MAKILVVGAHPDDGLLGCGGTIKLKEKHGDEILSISISKGRDDYLDQMFDASPLNFIIGKFRHILDDFNPDIVYTHCPNDINKDHRITNEAVMILARPSASISELYVFDITSDWAFGQIGSFKPNTFVDITETIEDKLNAMKEFYGDEMREYPHYRSLEKIRALAARWGSVIGVPYAEAFELIRLIG